MIAGIKRYSRLVIISAYCMISFATPSGVVFASEKQEIPASEMSRMAVVTDDSKPVPVTNDSQNMKVSPLVEMKAEAVQAPVVPVQAPPPQVIVAPPPPDLPASPLLVTAFKATDGRVNIVQIYNNSSSIERLSDWHVMYIAGDDEYEIQLGDGWILPKSYIVLGWEGESDFADIEFSFTDSVGPLESIVFEKTGYQPVRVVPPQNYTGQLLHRYKSSAGNYTTNTSFTVGAPTVYGGGLYVLPVPPRIQVREVLVQPRDCLIGDTSTDCYDYIKLQNISDQPLDLSFYRLRSGFSNAASSNSNTMYFDAILAPYETKTLQFDRNGTPLSLSTNDGTVWFEDRYGFQTYPLNVPPYIDSDLTSHRGQSWAYDELTSTWRWGIPSPNQAENRFPLEPGKGQAGSRETLKPCRDDQYRSEITNRCRSISTTSSTQKPCKEGQYRSEETNRCRSIATAAASVLKPCADDQFRNPTSGRCKKIASAEELKDCGEGRERNPVTSRCRNVLGASITKADFAPERVSASSSARIGWLIFGGVMLAAIGYGAWEWRYELISFVRRITKRE